MANSLASQLIGAGTQQTAGIDEKGLAQSYNQGAQLALEAEKIQQAKAQLEQQKQEAMMAKFEKVGSWFDTASKMPDGAAKQAYIKKFIPNGITALGIQDQIDPVALEMMQGDPNLAAYLKSEILKGNADMSVLTDPDQLAKFAAGAQQFGALENFQQTVSGNLGELSDTQTKKTLEGYKAERAETVAGMTTERAREARTATPQVEASKKIADAFADYEAAGGKATFDSGLEKLEGVLNALETGKVKTGGFTTFIPGFKSDTVQTMLNPKMVQLRTDAQSALNQALRQTLGAQFTENEGTRVLNQIWDDKQSPAENARRIRAEIKKLKADMKNRESQFKKQGFDFEPSKYTKDTPKASWKGQVSQQQKEQFKKFTAEKKSVIIKQMSERFKVSPEEIKKVMGE